MEITTPNHWDEFLLLQNKFAQVSSDNSFIAQVYDHALDLILNRLDKPSEFLSHNAYRNAKMTICRRKKNSNLIRDEEVDINHLVDDFVLLPHSCSHQEQFEQLLSFAVSCGRVIEIIVNHWYLGLSIEESAEKLHMTEAGVKKTRQRFKNKAKKFFL